MYVVNEGAGMEARRRELVAEVRALDLRCRSAGENVLSASLTVLGDELEAMSHGQLRRRAARIAEALHVVRVLLLARAAGWRARHPASDAAPHEPH